MRILVVGDFHGKFHEKISKIIKKDKIDFIVSNGDYLPFKYRKLWFKHCFAKDIGLWEVIGQKRYKKLVMEDLKIGENILKKLNSFSIPVFTVFGNTDWPTPDDISDLVGATIKHKLPHEPKWYKDDLFAKKVKKYKNIHRIDYSFAKFNDFILIGMRGHSFPGHVKSKGYKKHRAKLDNLFKKFRKENKNHKVIFVSHNVPYNTRLDKITSKEADKRVIGKHYGSKLARRIIDSYQPIIAIGGHIHEAKGMQKLGKTLAINSGSSYQGDIVLIDVQNNKMKVKFVK